nr:FAD-dependent oxidoreductase [Sphingomonas sp.]
MKSSARVVVIGGGVVGISTLYHLARMGWSDVVLVERKELTSGSTWHAAGLLPLFNLSYAVGQLHKYSVGFYPTLEAEPSSTSAFRTYQTSALPARVTGWTNIIITPGSRRRSAWTSIS